MSAEDLTETPAEEKKSEPEPKPAPPVKKPPKPHADPDEFLKLSKKLAVDNFNQYRDPQRSKELSVNQVYIVWFSKVLQNWKAIIASPVARNILWEVTYNGYRQTAYVDAYRKVNNTAIVLGGDDQKA